MNPFEMVVIIVALSVLGTLGKQWIDKRTAGMPAPGVIEGLRAEVARLSERVQTLEKLATDPARTLAREIDDLK